MEITEDTLWYVKNKTKQNKNLKIDRWIIFHPYANFNCPYLKLGLSDLFPVLLECITLFCQFHEPGITQLYPTHIA